MDKKSDMLYKKLIIGIIILLIVNVVIPSLAMSNNDDTTPPVTVCTLDPPIPNGENGWYVSDINVTLNATDDMSGVKEIYYRIDEGEWNNHSGDIIVFSLNHDCLIDGFIEFYAIDFAGNIEETKSLCCIDIDQIPPYIDLTWEVYGGNPVDGWEILFTATVFENCSGMDRVEFYLNGVLQETVTGPGPIYSWSFIHIPQNKIRVCGLILNSNISEKYVNLYSLIVLVSVDPGLEMTIDVCASDIAGNNAYDNIRPSFIIESGLYLFQNLTLPNCYKGYIGRFCIFATFFS